MERASNRKPLLVAAVLLALVKCMQFAIDSQVLFYDDSGSGGGGQVGVWNPQTNQLTVLASGPVTAFETPVRSGDGTHVYAANDAGYKTGMEVYNTNTKSLSTINSGTG